MLDELFGEFRQDIEPCLYAYCAESREEAEELHDSFVVSFLTKTQKIVLRADCYGIMNPYQPNRGI